MHGMGTPEERHLSTTSFSDRERTDWCALSSGEESKPRTWGDLQERMVQHFNRRYALDAKEKLTAVVQTGTFADYVTRFSPVASECVSLSLEHKLDTFITDLSPEFTAVARRCPRTREQATEFATLREERIRQNRRAHERGTEGDRRAGCREERQIAGCDTGLHPFSELDQGEYRGEDHQKSETGCTSRLSLQDRRVFRRRG